MAKIQLPMSVVFETEGVTPIADVVISLQAVEALSADAVALLPSLISGLKVESHSVNVEKLTQESPLREIFSVTIFLAFQEKLEGEVPALLEDIFKTKIPDDYDTILTLVFVVVVFYGIGLAKDVGTSVIDNNKTKKLMRNLLEELSSSAGKSTEEIENMLRSRFDKPNLVKRVIRKSVDFFRPSQQDSNAPLTLDRMHIDSDTVREVPVGISVEDDRDLETYKTITNVELSIHAQDKDKQATGWAAFIQGVTEKRLKMKVMSPILPSQVWGKDTVNGDVVIVSKLSGDDYIPAEIHLIGIRD